MEEFFIGTLVVWLFEHGFCGEKMMGPYLIYSFVGLSEREIFIVKVDTT
jgi:hypothetical protein